MFKILIEHVVVIMGKNKNVSLIGYGTVVSTMSCMSVICDYNNNY